MATWDEAAARGGAPARAEATARTHTGWRFFSWPVQIALLMLVIWFIPIKLYTLPIPLPFSLEVYRLLIGLLLLALAFGWLTGTVKLDAGGNGAATALLAVGAVLALVANSRGFAAVGAQDEAVKQLTYFLSFLVVFLIIVSTIRTQRHVDLVVGVLVVGGVAVAVSSIYESRTGYNLFTHLHEWIPFLDQAREFNQNIRRGNLRVRASAQHPIALGAALVLVVPLAVYMAGRATTRFRQSLWVFGALVLAVGSLATISRTVVLMLVGMLLCGLWVRRREVVRFWPLLLILPIVAQLAAPGAVRGLWKAFFPQQGVVTQQQNARVGGSGRVADLAPGISIWSNSPVWGYGLGTELDALAGSEGRAVRGVELTAHDAIVFDDQYMNTLVTLGLAGLIGVLWFVWGGVVRLGRTARTRAGPASDLAAACAIAMAGFGAGMLTFDAFAFVQVTLLFFVVAAVGLSARRLALTRRPRTVAS